MFRLMNLLKMNIASVLILSNFSLLLFVLNIPGTIALRNTLAGFLLIILILNWVKNEFSIRPLIRNKDFANTIYILLALTIYIFLHSVFIADEKSWSLSQYRTQWIYPMLYFLIGILLGHLSSITGYFSKSRLINFIFWTLFLHIFYLDLIAIYKYLENGQLLYRYGGLTNSSVLANYITNLLISMIIVEYIYRFKTKERMININLYFLFFILLMCVFSSIVEGMRFGVISLFFMSLTGLVFFIIDNPKYDYKVKILVAISIFLLCSAPLLYNAKSDSRWETLIETIPIALDTESNLQWRDNSEAPLLSNGQRASKSNYLRIAWISKGLEYISNDFFGIGYGRNVFGHAIEKYEDDATGIRGYHSHSSLIDLTIGIGLLGLFIWLFFVIRLIFITSKIFLNTGNYFALLSVFIISGFFIRSFVDSNMRDHMFKQFFILLGIALSLTFYEQIKNKKTI